MKATKVKTDPAESGNGAAVTTTKARAAIEADRKHRAEMCAKDYQAASKKWRCDLDVSGFALTPTGCLIPQVTIVPKD